jgi:hypothetical protein
MATGRIGKLKAQHSGGMAATGEAKERFVGLCSLMVPTTVKIVEQNSKDFIVSSIIREMNLRIYKFNII